MNAVKRKPSRRVRFAHHGAWNAPYNGYNGRER